MADALYMAIWHYTPRVNSGKLPSNYSVFVYIYIMYGVHSPLKKGLGTNIITN